MRIIRTHAAAFIGAIALALAAPSLSAQTATPARPERPAVVPDLPQRPEAETPERTYRYYRPVVRVGQDYTLRPGEEVQDVRTVFGDVTIEGRVTRDVVVVLGRAHLTSTAIVDGALVVVAGTATIDEGAAVHGDLVVAGGTLDAPSTFSPDGDHIVVGTPGLGAAFHGLVPWFTRGLLWGRLIVPGLDWIWMVVGVTFLVGLLVNTLFDRAVAGCADAIGQRPLSSFLLGLLVAVLTVPVIVILAATVVGLIVVPFVICAFILAGIVGKVGVARSIGRGIIRPDTPEERIAALFAFVFGAAVLVFLYMVPAIGVLTWALTGVLGLGAAASTFRGGLRREQPPRPSSPVEARSAPVPAAVAPAPAVEGEPVYAAAESMPVAPIAAPSFSETPSFSEAAALSEAAAPATAPAATAAPALPPADLALYPRATFLDRLAAFALDSILVAIVVQLLTDQHDDGLFPLMLVIYHMAFWAWKGTTLGGIICALRVIRTQGTALRPVDAVVRGLSAIFSVAALGIGCFWMLQDPERQMWHDKIAGTLVVKVPRHMAVP